MSKNRGGRYTKIHLGDSGTSQVYFNDPIRVLKGDLIFEFFGKGDELIATINLMYLYAVPDRVSEILERVIKLIYSLMADLSDKKNPFTRVTPADLEQIQSWIIEFYSSGSIKGFVYRYEKPQAIISNLVRVKVRELERIYMRLDKKFHCKTHIKVLNRLSNLFFELALWFESG